VTEPSLSATARWRRAAAVTARTAAVVMMLAGASGLLPRLILSQAVLIASLTMVAAPLSLLDRPATRWLQRLGPLPSCLVVGTSAIVIQLPAPASVVGGGGPFALAAYAVLFASAVAFWAVVVPQPARLNGLYAAGYVIAGSVPLSMPALLLMMVPTDLYAGYHAQSPPLIAAMTDQLLAGFVLFATVKVSVFTAFTAIFRAAAREVPADGAGPGGGEHPPGPPELPDWARGLGPASLSVEEPVPAREVPA
jgi:cytochrome c oxidase assembly factor CtaG